MPLTTVNVTGVFYAPDGSVKAGLLVEAFLVNLNFDDPDYVLVPDVVSAVTDASGTATLSLWPNSLGSYPSRYLLKVDNVPYGEYVVDHLDADGNPVTDITFTQLPGDVVPYVVNKTAYQLIDQARNQAAESAAASQQDATLAAQHKDDAETAANVAQRYAEEPEDSEISPGVYSSLHWAKKAES